MKKCVILLLIAMVFTTGCLFDDNTEYVYITQTETVQATPATDEITITYDANGNITMDGVKDLVSKTWKACFNENFPSDITFQEVAGGVVLSPMRASYHDVIIDHERRIISIPAFNECDSALDEYLYWIFFATVRITEPVKTIAYVDYAKAMTGAWILCEKLVDLHILEEQTGEQELDDDGFDCDRDIINRVDDISYEYISDNPERHGANLIYLQALLLNSYDMNNVFTRIKETTTATLDTEYQQYLPVFEDIDDYYFDYYSDADELEFSISVIKTQVTGTALETPLQAFIEYSEFCEDMIVNGTPKTTADLQTFLTAYWDSEYADQMMNLYWYEYEILSDYTGDYQDYRAVVKAIVTAIYRDKVIPDYLSRPEYIMNY